MLGLRRLAREYVKADKAGSLRNLSCLSLVASIWLNLLHLNAAGPYCLLKAWCSRRNMPNFRCMNDTYSGFYRLSQTVSVLCIDGACCVFHCRVPIHACLQVLRVRRGSRHSSLVPLQNMMSFNWVHNAYIMLEPGSGQAKPILSHRATNWSACDCWRQFCNPLSEDVQKGRFTWG